MSKYLLGIVSINSMMIYFQSATLVKENSPVVIDNPSIGLTIGRVHIVRELPDSSTASYASIIRVATKEDIMLEEKNKVLEKQAFTFTVNASIRQGLDMKIVDVNISLDCQKLLVVYSSEERVDFRELVKELAREYHMHIEMKQIGPRDRAQLIGGIGICGLKLCCSAFLKNFDVISISMAKNQMLSLNIPKLSGQCGKLICCLKYEDENYLELRKTHPRIGDKFIIKNQEYRVTGVNLLTSTITLYNGAEYLNIKTEELSKYRNANKNAN